MRMALVVALIASALGQQPSGQPFAGQWAADHDGHSVVQIDLRMNADALVGSIRLADIHVDAKGDVETVLSGLSAATMLIDVTTRNRTLAFSRRDGDDIDHFEMSVIDDRTAELRFLPSDAVRRELADNGIPSPRPIRLARVAQ